MQRHGSRNAREPGQLANAIAHVVGRKRRAEDLLRAFAIEREDRFGVRQIHDLPGGSALQVRKSSELDFRFRPLIFFTFEPTREPLICGHTARVGVAVAIIGFEHG